MGNKDFLIITIVTDNSIGLTCARVLLGNFMTMATLSQSLISPISGITELAAENTCEEMYLVGDSSMVTSVGYSPSIQVMRSMSWTAQSWKIPPLIFK